MRLLLLEDNQILGDGLRDYLIAEGHEVDWFVRRLDVEPLNCKAYDVLLVDWQLPDGSGLDWVRSLRARGVATPALMLTARDLLSDRISGLDSGVDDYLVKPFEPEELVARIRAVQRRSQGSASKRLRLGPVEIDVEGRCVYLDGERATLTGREWAVLDALVQRAGRVVSKADLEALMLDLGGELASNAIEVHVSHLRRKLSAELIETVRGEGYRVAR